MIEDGYPIFNKDEWEAKPGAQAGSLILIEIARGSGRQAYWKCFCLACGNYCEKRADRLKTGAIGGVTYSSGRRDNGTRSCGCKQKKTNFKNQANTAGSIESKYKEYTYSGIKILYKTDYMDKWGRPLYIGECPECKQPFPVFAHHETKHCGCKTNSKISMETYLERGQCRSLGEKKIYDLLTSVRVPFEQEKKFMNCCDKAPLPFDFYLESPTYGKYVIEFDGEQHFKQVSCFGDLATTHQHDLIKNKFCWEHGIGIIRIPYDADFELSDLSIATSRFILTPQNEKNYYNK